MPYECYGSMDRREELCNVRMVLPPDRTGLVKYRPVAVCQTGEDAALIVAALNQMERRLSQARISR